MKRIFKRIHLWLSIPFGLIISIICISGAALVFETEIMEGFYPNRYFVKEIKESPLPIDQLLENVKNTLPDSISITSVGVSSDPKRAYQVGLSKPRRASVYVDQYTGEVKPRFERSGFFIFMFRTHRWLLDSMKPDGGIFWGKMIVGTSTLFFVFIILSGIIAWIPRSVRTLRKKLKISTHKGWRRFWYDLHITGGTYIAIVLLVLALTGLTWSFSWYRTGFYKVFGVEVQQQSGHGQSRGQRENTSSLQTENRTGSDRNRRSEISEEVQGNREERRNREEQIERGNRGNERERTNTGERGNRGDRSNREERGERRTRDLEAESESSSEFFYWQPVYEELKTLNPGFQKITVSSASANVSFNRMGNKRASDRYTYDPATGKITETSLYKDQEKSAKIRGWIYSVHVGNWGGWFTRIISFVAALIGGVLPITGYYFWSRRIIKKRKRNCKS